LPAKQSLGERHEAGSTHVPSKPHSRAPGQSVSVEHGVHTPALQRPVEPQSSEDRHVAASVSPWTTAAGPHQPLG
jgi:hypothetical protein